MTPEEREIKINTAGCKTEAPLEICILVLDNRVKEVLTGIIDSGYFPTTTNVNVFLIDEVPATAIKDCWIIIFNICYKGKEFEFQGCANFIVENLHSKGTTTKNCEITAQKELRKKAIAGVLNAINDLQKKIEKE